MLRLADYVVAHMYKGKGVFGAGSKQLLFENMEEWNVLVCVASMWTVPHTKEQILEEISKKYNFSKKQINDACELLLKNNFLIDDLWFNEQDRYSRNSLYYAFAGANPKDVQNKLKNSTVAIVGCGGIGNYISHNLVTSGVGKIVLVDNDKIELSNLTRQFLFSESDVGKYKVDVLERELKKRNSNISIAKYPLAINSERDFYKINEKVDLFVLSADSPSDIIYWMNRFSVDNLIPYLNVGYINDISTIGPFVIPGKTACFECSQVVPDRTYDKISYINECNKINSSYRPPSFPSVNGVAASFAVGDILRYLGQYGMILSANKRIGIHSLQIKIEIQEIIRSGDCKICGHL